MENEDQPVASGTEKKGYAGWDWQLGIAPAGQKRLSYARQIKDWEFMTIPKE